MKKLAPLLLAAVLAGCGARQQPNGGPAPAPAFTPAEQCQAMQAAADTADLGLAFVKIKDPTVRAAVDSAFVGVAGAVQGYCDAAAAGTAPDGLAVALAAYRVALADFKASVRAARAASPPV